MVFSDFSVFRIFPLPMAVIKNIASITEIPLDIIIGTAHFKITKNA